MNLKRRNAGAACLLAGVLTLSAAMHQTGRADEPAGVARVSDGVFYGTQTRPNSFYFKGDNASGFYTEYPQRQPTYVDWHVYAPGPPYGPECSGFTGAMIGHAAYFRARTKAFTCNSYSYMKTRFWDGWDQIWTHTSYDPVNPGYADPRDAQIYAAQGAGVPVAVPLAPVVQYTYNYGWGVPSSRLTRVGGGNSSRAQYGLSTAAQGPAQVIYTPTDTTQLGYYYQSVPTWQPASSVRYGAHAPNMGGAGGGAMNCPPAGNTPSQPTPAIQPAPMPASGPQPVPPAPVQ